ncbi:SCO3242 family prenyltransferase [Streptomyces sp. 7N604]|uniref:SCO3242 family prenyltransferase n=1 Tax=Streptomyces sp. 7N604 TaxID=3457415 RepID=UPI003FD0C002
MTVRTCLGALARLVRAPAALTVPGDVFAGAAAGGVTFRPRLLGTVASSMCLYWAGMALNDYADRAVDAEERPERPIPAGEVTPAAALATAVALTASGLGLAVLCEGRRGLLTAVPLTAAVWAYDTVAKDTAAGPAAMGAARAIDVLRGADPGRLSAALPAALTVAVHTASVTGLSRHEATPAPRTATPRPAAREIRAAALGALAADATTGTFVVLGARRAKPLDRIVAGVLAAGFVAMGGRAQLTAVRTPSPYRVRRAVAAGIHGMVPLQSALVAAAGRSAPGLVLLAAYPLARGLSRRVSPT